MIQSEYLNDGTLIRQYSDKGVLLLQVETGEKYPDPIDTVPCMYTYIETDELIEPEIEEEEDIGMDEDIEDDFGFDIE